MKSQCIIIGGGIIGLSIARKFAMSGIETLLLESNSDIGLETTFRNSAVIHAGIYYPADSLKAKLCVLGNKLLYAYCEENSVPHKRIGKIIVATNPNQLPDLEKIYAQAKKNNVSGMKLLDKDELHEMEPSVSAIKGLLSETTGILNGKDLMMSYKKDFKLAGGKILTSSKVTQGKVIKDGFQLFINDSCEPIECKYLVNAAGLWAQSVAKKISGIPENTIPGTYYAKGNYFTLNCEKSPFNKLIYPVPEKAGLGIHATLDMNGAVRFGPDVEWVSSLDYSVNESRKESFINAIKTYYPAIKAEDLIPLYAGIRPKSQPKDLQPQDFDIQSETSHGVANLINLYGMESPGLTSSLAIAEYIYSLFPAIH